MITVLSAVNANHWPAEFSVPLPPDEAIESHESGRVFIGTDRNVYAAGATSRRRERNAIVLCYNGRFVREKTWARSQSDSDRSIDLAAIDEALSWGRDAFGSSVTFSILSNSSSGVNMATGRSKPRRQDTVRVADRIRSDRNVIVRLVEKSEHPGCKEAQKLAHQTEKKTGPYGMDDLRA